ncbi:MAG: chitin-binding domain-containing protein [Candidatus Saccharimonadales bacterium]
MVGGVCVDNKTSPTTCPSGMMFNANSGQCETAAPIVCPSGSRPGTVNGQSVCASSSSIDPTQARVPQSSNTGTSSGTETTTTTQKDANGNITGTSTSTTNTTTNLTLNTTGLASEQTQQGILNALTENSKANGTVTAANTSGVDSTESTAETQANITNPASYFINSFVVLPSASCQSVPMHHKSLQYDFDPCTKLQSFRDLLGYFLYIITLIFIYQTATRPSGD